MSEANPPSKVRQQRERKPGRRWRAVRKPDRTVGLCPASVAGLPKRPPWSALAYYRSSRRASRAGQYWCSERWPPGRS
jgi:hypothetical protein